MEDGFLSEHFSADLSFSHQQLCDFLDDVQRAELRQELREREASPRKA